MGEWVGGRVAAFMAGRLVGWVAGQVVVRVRVGVYYTVACRAAVWSCDCATVWLCALCHVCFVVWPCGGVAVWWCGRVIRNQVHKVTVLEDLAAEFLLSASVSTETVPAAARLPTHNTSHALIFRRKRWSG